MVYDHLPEKQRSQLSYGGKIRYARCLIANAESAIRMYPGMFTDAEIKQIQKISLDAIDRAKTDFAKDGGRPASVDSESSWKQPQG